MTERELTATATLQALLGQGAEFDGRLFFADRVRIDGKLRGQIEGEGLLVIGDGADIDAELRVGSLIVRGGLLRGTVHATNAIEIHKAARVFADLSAPTIDMEKGCTFEGRCSITGAAEASAESKGP